MIDPTCRSATSVAETQKTGFTFLQQPTRKTTFRGRDLNTRSRITMPVCSLVVPPCTLHFPRALRPEGLKGDVYHMLYFGGAQLYTKHVISFLRTCRPCIEWSLMKTLTMKPRCGRNPKVQGIEGRSTLNAKAAGGQCASAVPSYIC